ncbi:hypothetical protein HUJ05_000087 [Dendroctonus ponderosae]|nr:hypothetical protein HUJ05_000087 [Dendroctonus ponderosae]
MHPSNAGQRLSTSLPKKKLKKSDTNPNPNFGVFYSLIEGCQICNFTLMYEPLTVFAPINAAFQKLVGVPEDPDSLAQYHLKQRHVRSVNEN